MDLSVIIINYKSAPHVLACLQSVYAQTFRHHFEVIVVDNASGDDSESRIRTAFPQVVWIQTGYNAGFARANNAGIRASSGRYVLLLNADTIVLDNALDKTIALFEQSRAVGCGVQLLNPDGSHQISGAHFVRGGLNFLLPLPYLGRGVRYLGYKFKAKVPSVQTVSDVVEVDWIVGAFILVEHGVLKKVGPVRRRFFMYAEEIEWCARLRRHGKLVLFAEPKIVHLGGGASSDYYDTAETENSKNLWNKKGRQIMVSQFLRIRKQYGLFWFAVICALFIIEIPLFAACLLVEKLVRGSKARYRWADVRGYMKNISVLLRHVPTMIRNQPYFYKVF